MQKNVNKHIKKGAEQVVGQLPQKKALRPGQSCVPGDQGTATTQQVPRTGPAPNATSKATAGARPEAARPGPAPPDKPGRPALVYWPRPQAALAPPQLGPGYAIPPDPGTFQFGIFGGPAPSGPNHALTRLGHTLDTFQFATLWLRPLPAPATPNSVLTHTPPAHSRASYFGSAPSLP